MAESNSFKLPLNPGLQKRLNTSGKNMFFDTQENRKFSASKVHNLGITIDFKNMCNDVRPLVSQQSNMPDEQSTN